MKSAAIFITVVVLVVFVFHEINLAATESDRSADASRKDWRAYSETHQCKLTGRAGFWGASDIWQCTTDGKQFEVIRPLRDE